MDSVALGPGVGRVAINVYAEVVNRSLDVLGVVYPERRDLTIVNDSKATIMRRVDGVALTRSDYKSLNPAADLLRLIVEVDGRRRPLGAFYFTTDDDPVGVDYGLGGPMVDAGLVLSFDTTRSYSLPPGGSIVSLIQDVVTDCGFTRLAITDTGAYVYDPVTFPAGTTKRSILAKLADLGGYLPPYFDNDGTFVVRPVDNIDDDPTPLDYTDTRIAKPVASANLLDAPNVYRVVNNGAPNAEVAALAYVDASAPWSREARGFDVVKTINQQGIKDYGSALRMAEALAARDAASYAGWEFDGPLDARHDTFSAVRLNDVVYREVYWSANLRAGTMQHRLVRTMPLKENTGG